MDDADVAVEAARQAGLRGLVEPRPRPSQQVATGQEGLRAARLEVEQVDRPARRDRLGQHRDAVAGDHDLAASPR